MKINNTTQILAKEIAGFYDDKRGRRHTGYSALREYRLLEHPERLARITVGQINSGAKVAQTAIGIGEAVEHTNHLQMIWRERYDIGLFLMTVAVESGLYEIRRCDKEGSAPDPKVAPWSTEPYRIYATGAPARQTLGYLSVGTPFPKWTDNNDQDGRRLLQSNCYTPDVDPNKTWVHAVHHVESIGFRINHAVLEVVQCVGVKTTNAVKQAQREDIVRTAEGLKDSTFYHRAHVDQRGRIYISRSPINYQQNDIARALLEFADGVPLTTEGLDAIYLHIANCHGEKCDIKGRIQFGKDNHDKWASYAGGSSDEWLRASEPWQLLRACIELTTTRVGGASHLVVPIDQSCSGLAWQAVVMNDKPLADLTNLQGGCHDLCTIIGEQLKLPTELGERRNIVKKSVMPRSYGAVARTIATDLRDWARLNPEEAPYLNTLDLNFVKDKRGNNSPSLRLMGIAQTAIDLLASMAPATKTYAKSVRQFYRSRLDQGLPYVQWLSPSGFFCRVRKEETEKVTGSLPLSAGRVQIVAHAPTGKIAYSEMIRASMANTIHSLDASLVHITLANSDHQIVPVHDSFGSHPSNAFKTQTMLMENLALIERMDPSLCLIARDYDDTVTWSELQAQDAIQQHLDGDEITKQPVVDTTATNVFS